MERYDYMEAVISDIHDYLEENAEVISEYADARELLENHLNDLLWVCDSVTGNASGSYTFNTWKAEENLCHNLELLSDALEEFGCDLDANRGAEFYDVTIRCYLLPQAISKALDRYVFNSEE